MRFEIVSLFLGDVFHDLLGIIAYFFSSFKSLLKLQGSSAPAVGKCINDFFACPQFLLLSHPDE